jgi:hypothetical protein
MYFLYGGPAISGVRSSEALAKLFEWFESVGGTKNRDNFLGGFTNGISTIIPKPLRSPRADEWTVGASTDAGGRGFVRADVISRQWKDFYTTRANRDTGTVFDPLADTTVDVYWITNSNEFERRYRALQLQAGYNVTPAIHFGANYTYAKLTGNYEGETAAGPMATDSAGSYPEIQGFANNNPIGALSGDQRHKLRAWLTYERPALAGTLTLSVLQGYDSGTPYSMVGSIDVSSLNKEEYGYATPPVVSNYYFSKRGAFRWDGAAFTNVAASFSLPLAGSVAVRLEAKIWNVLNQHAVTGGDATVLTSIQEGCKQTANPALPCEGFNPFTEKPVEGVNYIRGPHFGQSRTPTNFDNPGDYQLPRSIVLSTGIRF